MTRYSRSASPPPRHRHRYYDKDVDGDDGRRRARSDREDRYHRPGPSRRSPSPRAPEARSRRPDSRSRSNREDRDHRPAPPRRSRSPRAPDARSRSNREFEDRDHRPRPGPSRGGRSRSPRAAPAARSRHSDSRSKSPNPDKAKPNFSQSGLLAAATNTVKHNDGTATVLKYNEPPEARKPLLGWRLYVFKGSEQVDLLHVHRQSAYLIGRDRAITDISVDHPSCSKQHAVIQFRQVQEKDEYGSSKAVVKPFIIDLESTNGTHVNDDTIPVSRYYELKASDVIKFGQSTREYVLLHDEA